MKSFIVSIIIAAIVIAGSIMYTHRLETISDELIAINDTVTERIESENYGEADEKIRELDEYLEEQREMLATTGNHQELDNIQIYLAELKRFSADQMKTDALSRCQVLDFLFHHLPQDYRLRIENIL